MEEVKVKVRIPTNWNDVTLETYLKYKKTLDLYKNDDDEDEVDVVNKSIIIALDILCGVAPAFASQMPVEILSHVMESLNSFMNESKFDLQRIITIDGVEYGFEPNLSNMSYGAYLDISKYDKITIDNNWTKIMSILYRPIVSKSGKLYEIKEYTAMEDHSVFLKTTMDINFGCISFFLHLSRDLALYTLKSLREGQETNLLLQSIMEKSGKDIPQS
jgi:hypothetical protein